MEKNKNKYPGFIDGLKASNIASNKTSLNVSSEQIESLITEISKENFQEPLKDNVARLNKAIKETINPDINAEELIQKYIKFGDLFNLNLPELKKHNILNILKQIAINYLQVAKFTKDTRIKNLSIVIANELEN